MPAIGLAQPEQHEFFTLVEVQREPVPSGLIRSERLAAPFPVHPGEARYLGGFVADGDTAARLEKRLAEIIRGLSALRFPAVAGVALQHQRTIGVEPQRVGEIGARRLEVERRQHRLAHRIGPAHFP